MGACFSDCWEVYFSSDSDYEVIPDRCESHPRRSVSSVTTGSYQSDGVLWGDGGSADLLLPSQFSDFYLMGELVGIGTTAKVFKVQHKAAGKWAVPDRQPLACKIIDKKSITYDMDNLDIDPLLEQLCREVEILKRIHHPNIVDFYDYIETKGQIYIITERLDGGELFEYILNNGPLHEEFACRVLHGVFSAVAYLHDRGVVHRDIKAENLIFFTDADGKQSLKLIDFGFSTILRHKLTGSFMGTGGYIAPEIRQHKNYSTSVDTWSLGVLMYCSMSARLPFGIGLDKLPASIEECKGAFDLTFPAKHWADKSSACKDLISQLLEIDPNKRLTAKAALNHPWFADQEESFLRSDCTHDIDGQCDLPNHVIFHATHPSEFNFVAASRAQAELSPLYNPLRLALSMGELEMRSSEIDELIALRSGSPYFLNENCLTPYSGWLSNSTSEKSGRQRASSNPILSAGTSTCGQHLPLTSYNRSRSMATAETDSSGSFETTHYHSWAAAGKCDVPSPLEEELPTNHDKINKNYYHSNTRSIAFWEETHHQTAGDLFYTTSQRIATWNVQMPS